MRAGWEHCDYMNSGPSTPQHPDPAAKQDCKKQITYACVAIADLVRAAVRDRVNLYTGQGGITLNRRARSHPWRQNGNAAWVAPFRRRGSR
jgi:hypothetical protein